MNKFWYISVYPTPGYFRHFIVQEETPLKALYKLNYQARKQYEAMKELIGIDDPYRKLERIKHIITGTRRFKRKHKDTFGHKNSRYIIVHELPMQQVWEGQLKLGAMDYDYAWNILPNISFE